MSRSNVCEGSHAGPARNSERGAAVVEFAVVLVPLLMILLGVVEFGRVYSLQLSMQYAAREAARTIALKYDDPGMTQELLDSLVDDTLVDLLPNVNSVADLASVQPVIEGCDPTGSVTDDTTSVRLTHDVDVAIPFVDVSALQTVRAYAEMPCEG